MRKNWVIILILLIQGIMFSQKDSTVLKNNEVLSKEDSLMNMIRDTVKLKYAPVANFIKRNKEKHLYQIVRGDHISFVMKKGLSPSGKFFGWSNDTMYYLKANKLNKKLSDTCAVNLNDVLRIVTSRPKKEQPQNNKNSGYTAGLVGDVLFYENPGSALAVGAGALLVAVIIVEAPPFGRTLEMDKWKILRRK